MTRACLITALLLVTVAASSVSTAADPPTKLPAGAIEWKDNPNFVHPPIECQRPYKRIVEYPVSAWCFHGINAARSPYAEKYVKDAKAIGFNVLIDDERILPYAEKVGGVKVQLAKLWLNPSQLDKQIFSNPKIGDHPLVQAVITGDNGRGFGGGQIAVSDWLTANYPHIPGILSVYPHRRPRTDTSLRIWHMQNYPYLRGARGTGACTAYCGQLEADRQFCNKGRMAMWECFGGDAPFACVRFQMHAALAYGAQGLSNFCYSPHRMAGYKPGGPMVPKWFEMNQYIIHVLGRHVWGLRSMKVLHSIHGGRHRGAQGFDAGQCVVRAEEYMMVGLLTPEAKFYSKNEADRALPEYFMVVDKRTGGNVPPARDVYVMLATQIPVVELIDRDATKDVVLRKLVPGSKIRLTMLGSDAVLLRIAPDLEKLLGGPGGLKLYAKINTALAALQWKATPPAEPGKAAPEADLKKVAVPRAAIATVVKAAKADAKTLADVLATAVKAKTISRAQADDTLKRLADAIDATAAEAKALKTE